MSATRPQTRAESSGPVESSRRGAHRARSKPLASGLPVVAGVLVMVIVVGLGWTLFTGGNDTDKGSSLGAADPDPTSSARASSTPRASATTAAPAASGAASTGASSDGGTTPVNRDVPLEVLNSTGVQGLAKVVAAKLDAAGWKTQRTDNSQEQGLGTTKVYYGSDKAGITANALIKDLGYGEAVQNRSVATNGELVVVVGHDAE